VNATPRSRGARSQASWTGCNQRRHLYLPNIEICRLLPVGGVTPDYRIFETNQGRIVGPARVITCDHDEEAIRRAKLMVDAFDVELWQGGTSSLGFRPERLTTDRQVCGR
jgi:hypothetical protein